MLRSYCHQTKNKRSELRKVVDFIRGFHLQAFSCVEDVREVTRGVFPAGPGGQLKSRILRRIGK